MKAVGRNDVIQRRDSHGAVGVERRFIPCDRLLTLAALMD